MMKSMVLLAGGVLAVLGGCATDSKTEANAVNRKYNRPAPEVWNAVTNALQALDLRIEEDRHDALGGELSGLRATGDEVRVRVRSVDESTSQVSISIEEGDRNMAEIIHSQVAKNLGTSTAKTSFYGGNRWEQTYDTSLARALLAADRACEAIGFNVTSREVRESSADLMSQRPGSPTVLMHFETAQQQPQANAPAQAQPPAQQQPPANGGRGVPSDKVGQVKVSFIVGTMRNEEHEDLLQRLRSEFERFVR